MARMTPNWIDPLSRDPNKEIPKFSVFDIETNNWIDHVVTGYYDGKDYKDYGSIIEFLDDVSKNRDDKITIFAHNGGGFDFNFVLECIIKGEGHKNYKLEKIFSRGATFLSIEVLNKTTGTTLLFRDSLAMLPFTLKSLTTNFKTECAKGEWDHVNDFKYRDDPRLLEYLKADCIGLYQVLDAYFHWPLIKESGAAFTVASQALKVFRTFLDERILGCNESVDAFVRRGYFGGRTEVFRPYFKSTIEENVETKISCFDINSLYPSVMKDFDYPTRFVKWSHAYTNKMFGFWEATVEVPKDMYVPPLGAILKIDKITKKVEVAADSSMGKFIFPTGTFSGVWSSIELEYAKSVGVKVLKIGKGALFDNGGPIFKEFITELYEMRMKAEKDSVDSFICKLLLNSCYGRFGLNLDRENIVRDDGYIPITGLTPYTFFTGETVNGIPVIERFVKIEERISSFTNVAIAAWVTAHARIRMHKEYMKCQDKLYYTDSVTGRRMVTIRKKGLISQMSMEELYNIGFGTSIEGKDRVFPGGHEIETLSYKPGEGISFKPISQIIRHESNKKIFRVWNNKGETEITEDHSLIDEHNNKLSFREAKTLFTQKDLSNIQTIKIVELDLWKYVQDTEIPSFPSTRNHKFAWGCDSEFIFIRNISTGKINEGKFQRFFSGKDLDSFCKVLGFYIAEGSVSTPLTTKTRWMFSFCNDDTEYLNEMKSIIEKFYNMKFSMIKSSVKGTDNTWKVTSGTKVIAQLFAVLSGLKSSGRKIPDFIFNVSDERKKIFLDSINEGDGSFCFGKAYSEEYRKANFRYETNSRILANNYCLLISMLGYCYSVRYRKEKDSYCIASSTNQREKEIEFEQIESDGFVYDIEVEETHNFFDSIGFIGLHNTDSVFVKDDNKIATSKDLGKFKYEYSATEACFLLPKAYCLAGITGLKDVKGQAKKTKEVIKGINEKAIKSRAVTVDDFFNLLEGEFKRADKIPLPIEFIIPEKVSKIKTAMRKGTFLDVTKEAPKQFTAKYDKREIYLKENGDYDTRPIYIENGVATNYRDPDIKVDARKGRARKVNLSDNETGADL